MGDFISDSLLFSICIVIAIFASGVTTVLLAKPIIRRMKERGIVGIDWNKRDRPEIAELGGFSLLFGFPIGIAIATGILKLFSVFVATTIIATIGVMFIAGIIGILDDISNIPQRVKAIVVAFAALPLIIAGTAELTIPFPFGFELDFSGSEALKLIFWLIVVPIGITGAANAINMSAGYNGLETGQVAIISVSLMIAAILTQRNADCILIFAALAGAAIGLNYYNGYPALTFVGDVGTLSMGAAIGAGVIIGGMELAGVIAVLPAFYEAFATFYYSLVKKVDRKEACARPVIDEDNRLHPPAGAERYTLAYLILHKRAMTERGLVRTILSLYVACGIIAVIVQILSS